MKQAFPGLTAAGPMGQVARSNYGPAQFPAPAPCLSPVGRQSSLDGGPLQLPGLGHNGRDMLLFLILFFYKKNQCQSTDPLRHQAGRAEPAALFPQLGGSVTRGGPARSSGQGGVRPGQPHGPSRKWVHLTLECTTHPSCREGPPTGPCLLLLSCPSAPLGSTLPPIPLRARTGGWWEGHLSANGGQTQKPQGTVMEGVLFPCS